MGVGAVAPLSHCRWRSIASLPHVLSRMRHQLFHLPSLMRLRLFLRLLCQMTLIRPLVYPSVLPTCPSTRPMHPLSWAPESCRGLRKVICAIHERLSVPPGIRWMLGPAVPWDVAQIYGLIAI